MVARYRSEEIKAGIVIFISIIILAGFVLQISRRSLKETATYRSRFEYVRGLNTGAVVTYAGLKVGTVRNLFIPEDADEMVEVVFEIPADISVREGAMATISTIGLMGESNIEIIPGEKGAPLIPHGSLIDSLAPANMEDLLRSAELVAEQFDLFLVKVHAAMDDVTGEGARETVASLVDMIRDSIGKAGDTIDNINALFVGENKENIEAALAGFRTGVEEVSTQVQDALITVERLANRLDSLTSESEDDIRAALANLRILTENLEEMTDDNREDIRNTVKSMQNFVAQLEQTLVDNRGNIDETVVNLKQATHSGKEFAERVRKTPWRLIWPGRERRGDPGIKDLTVR